MTTKMFGKDILFFLVAVLLISAQYQDNSHKITAFSKSFCSSDANCHHLFARREGFEVGHNQLIQFKGKEIQMVTRSLRPLIFEIPGFLSDTDCDGIVELAKMKGLEVSRTLADYSTIASPIKMNSKISWYKRIGKRFFNYLSSVEKMKKFINLAESIYLHEKDAEKIFKLFDVNNDKNITEKELFLASDKVMQRLYSCLEEYKSRPLYRPRYSSQTWLSMTGKLLEEIEEKIARVTNLPKFIAENSEDLQVVHYSINGHFQDHYDSTEDNIGKELQCCTGLDMENCHLCRYITILFFLNDVAHGGETVFPLAEKNYVYWQQQPLNLSLRHNTNIVIKPKKGTAIMWYNHLLNPKTGLLGNLDVYSLHRGCDVLQGSKWIANKWINIPK